MVAGVTQPPFPSRANDSAKLAGAAMFKSLAGWRLPD